MATADRLEAELGSEQFMYDGGRQREIEGSPEPGPPITVGLDGGYIRGRDRPPGGTGCFEVIAGKGIPEEGAARADDTLSSLIESSGHEALQQLLHEDKRVFQTSHPVPGARSRSRTPASSAVPRLWRRGAGYCFPARNSRGIGKVSDACSSYASWLSASVTSVTSGWRRVTGQ